MIQGVSSDREFQKKATELIKERSLSRVPFALRNTGGVTQNDMAKKLGCTQSKISKLETASIDSIRVSDLVDYAKALDLNISISFHSKRNIVQNIKYHALQIRMHLDRLVGLAYKEADAHK